MSKAATPDGVEQVAARKLIFRLAEVDGEEMPTDTTLIDAVNEAVEQFEEMTARIDALEDRIDELETATPDAEAKEYGRMDKHDKAAVVRSKLREVAENTNGKAAFNYKDVIRVFEGQPSSGHAYDVMEVAGNADGFNYGESPGGTKRLTVDLTE
jgi:hypothetical protein